MAGQKRAANTSGRKRVIWGSMGRDTWGCLSPTRQLVFNVYPTTTFFLESLEVECLVSELFGGFHHVMNSFHRNTMPFGGTRF